MLCRPHRPSSSRELASTGGDGAPVARGAGGTRPGDRVARVVDPRLRRRVRAARRIPGPVSRLRPCRRAVPELRPPDPPGATRGAIDALLSQVPEVTRDL